MIAIIALGIAGLLSVFVLWGTSVCVYALAEDHGYTWKEVRAEVSAKIVAWLPAERRLRRELSSGLSELGHDEAQEQRAEAADYIDRLQMAGETAKDRLIEKAQVKKRASDAQRAVEEEVCWQLLDVLNEWPSSSTQPAAPEADGINALRETLAAAPVTQDWEEK